ncbi:hypothetical protein Tco_1496549, partial [Tanacetum coccineum]
MDNKESIAGTQAVLPQTKGEKGSVVTSPTQTWRPKMAYLDHRHKNNGSYTLKKFEYGNPEEELKDHAIIDSGCSGSMTGDKDKLSDFKVQLFGSQYWNDEPITMFKGRTAGKVWTLKEDLMLFLRGERNADFHESTAKVRMLNEVAYIEAKIAGKKILVSKATVRTDLMFNDEDGT